MLILSWFTACLSCTASVIFIIDTCSPVSIDWSIFSTVDIISITLISAGILSPTKERERERGGSEKYM